jgi:DNA-binding transcriptional ArsR family regulator
MVNYHGEQLDRIFHALSDETRRAMLARLAEGECNVSALAEPFHISLAAVSKHLKVLEDAGLVRKEKEGRTYRCRPHFESLHEANALLEHFAAFWQGRLDTLEKLLTAESTQGDHHGTSPSTNPAETRHPKSHSRKKRTSV